MSQHAHLTSHWPRTSEKRWGRRRHTAAEAAPQCLNTVCAAMLSGHLPRSGELALRDNSTKWHDNDAVETPNVEQQPALENQRLHLKPPPWSLSMIFNRKNQNALSVTTSCSLVSGQQGSWVCRKQGTRWKNTTMFKWNSLSVYRK